MLDGEVRELGGRIVHGPVPLGKGELCPQLILDDSKHEWEYLYVEARSWTSSVHCITASGCSVDTHKWHLNSRQ